MNYFVDVSFDLSRQSFNDTKRYLIEQFEKNNGYRYYENFELSGINRVIKRNHCVITFNFEEEEEEEQRETSIIPQIIKFIKEVKNMRKNNKVYVECVYSDLKVIYASKHYLKMLGKYQYNEYKRSQETMKITEEDILLREIICK